VRVYLPAVSGSDLASAWRAEGQLSAEQGPGCCRRMPSSSDSCGAYSRRSGPVMTCPRLLTFTNVYSAMLGIGTFCAQNMRSSKQGRFVDHVNNMNS